LFASDDLVTALTHCHRAEIRVIVIAKFTFILVAGRVPLKAVTVEPLQSEYRPALSQDDDPRMQLVERIIATPSFQKANRLQALLRYIVECSINGAPDQLSEAHIGQRVFDKGSDYSPLTDSSVRVQARQLRLKLHEYFDGPGRDEPLILEIPKGSYAPTFRSVKLPDYEPPHPIDDIPTMSTPAEQKRSFRILPWLLVGLTAPLCGYLAWSLHSLQVRSTRMMWPLVSVFEERQTTRLILADSSYQIISTATGKPAPLDDYLGTRRQNENAIRASETFEGRALHALAGGTFTSFADAVVVSAVSGAAAQGHASFDLKSARDIDPRDLEQGNFIFVGSPSSNPWVSLYDNKLNFRESSDPNHPSLNRFLNLHPRSNESPVYEGTDSKDQVREDFADFAVISGLGDHGTVMIIQGLRHEGTEAVGRLLMDVNGSELLKSAFGNLGYSVPPKHFETLLAITAVAGIPHVTRIVAIRVL
jgi:hypothetical protein